MRVLLWSDYFWPALGGTELFALHLIQGLEPRGVEFTVVTNDPETSDPAGVPPVEGIEIVRLPLRRALEGRDPEPIAAVHEAVRRLVRRKPLDLVHEISLGPGDVFLGPALRRAPAPRLLTLQQDIPAPLLAPGTALGRAVREASWIATCSVAIRDHLLRCAPETSDRSSVIRCAVSEIAPPPPPSAPPRILCLGRLVDYKGFDVAIEAFSIIHRRCPEAGLIVAGDGPERARLEEQSRRLGLASAVEFAGWVHPDRTAALIASATAVLMPSRKEPGGTVALETARAARPIVATRAGGLAEAVVDGETGTLVEIDDTAAMARALLRLLGDPVAAAAMGSRGRARVERLFSLSAHLEAYEALYNRVAGRHRGADGSSEDHAAG